MPDEWRWDPVIDFSEVEPVAVCPAPRRRSVYQGG